MSRGAARGRGPRDRPTPHRQQQKEEWENSPGPREIVKRLGEKLAEANIIGAVQLASGDRDALRAVDSAHARDQFLRFRHFRKDGDVYRLPEGVTVGYYELANRPQLSDIDGALGPAKVPKIDELHGTLPYGALRDKPNLSNLATKDEVRPLIGPAAARRIAWNAAQQVVNNMVKNSALR